MNQVRKVKELFPEELFKMKIQVRLWLVGNNHKMEQ
jgi:hypothetical protein